MGNLTGVAVGIGVDVGSGVGKSTGVAVGNGVGRVMGVALGCGGTVGCGVALGIAAIASLSLASTVAWMASSLGAHALRAKKAAEITRMKPIFIECLSNLAGDDIDQLAGHINYRLNFEVFRMSYHLIVGHCQ